MTNTVVDNRQTKSRKKEPEEGLIRWVVRYVFIPLAVAAIGAWVVLEAVNLEIEARDKPVEHTHEDIAADIFATLTAVATNSPATPTATPSSTPTHTPAPTEQADEEEVGDSAPAEQVVVVPPPGACGQVPFGWQLYTVQRGNTFYSLAQQTGTTIAAIRQVNCHYGQLLAFEQIWLPRIAAQEPEPPDDDPTPTVTPTITVTEMVLLPDIINDSRDWPSIQVSCSEGDCATTVNFAVTNVGAAVADSFNILVRLDPDQSVVLNQAVSGLEPGSTQVFSLTSPPGGNCYDPNCQVCLTVDSRDSVLEEDEANNLYCTTFNG